MDDLLRQAEEVAKESNRATAATRNAEIRKSKQWLLADGLAGLQKKVKKGRGVTKELIEERQRRVGLPAACARLLTESSDRWRAWQL